MDILNEVNVTFEPKLWSPLEISKSFPISAMQNFKSFKELLANYFNSEYNYQQLCKPEYIQILRIEALRNYVNPVLMVYKLHSETTEIITKLPLDTSDIDILEIWGTDYWTCTNYTTKGVYVPRYLKGKTLHSFLSKNTKSFCINWYNFG